MQALRTGLAAVCGSAILSACAPDAWRPDNAYEAFLNRVQKACYYDPIGTTTVGSLLEPGGSDAQSFFLDETSRFYNGRITQQNWLLAITSQFQVNAGDRGVQCILAEYDKEKGKPK